MNRSASTSRSGPLEENFSVVIATRNRAGVVVQAIKSILAGSLQPHEVLIVDQSADGTTEAALREAFSDDPRIRYYRDAGRGAARGRNVGLALARADLIAVTDDDCLVSPTWLATLGANFARYPSVDLIYGQVKAPPDCSQYVVPTLALSWRIEYGLSRLSGRLQGMSANMALRRRLVQEIGPFDYWFGAGGPRPSAEDCELHYRALRAGRHVLLDPACQVLHLGGRPPYGAWALWRRDALGCGALAARIAADRRPLVAAQFWWWTVGHLIQSACLRLLLLRMPTGLRMAGWMWWHSLQGFLMERREPGPVIQKAAHNAHKGKERRTPIGPD